MTWLSRLLPQTRTISRSMQDPNHRTRQSKRHRRMSTVEALEGRTLLSNVVAQPQINPVDGSRLLVIRGDGGKDAFSVTLNPGGTVTVAARTDVAHVFTTINSNPFGTPFTTVQPIKNIYINLPGASFNGSSDWVTVTGKGTTANVFIVVPGTSTTGMSGASDLKLNVHDLSLSNGFFLYDAPTTGTGPNAITPAFSPPNYNFPLDAKGNPLNFLGGKLDATIDNSSFNTALVEQDGCCLASVEMSGDHIPGSVTVLEGQAPGDKIVLSKDNFGSTSLIQGYGPATGCNSAGDLIQVDDSFLIDLTTRQDGAGGGQQLLVGTLSDVQLSQYSFGIYATQFGNGDGDVIHIQSITTFGRPSNTKANGPDSIETHQGSGAKDSTTVDSSLVFGNILITQGNGAGDSVHVANDQIGFLLPFGPYFQDEYGVLQVLQGNGYEDSVVVDSNGSEPTPVGNVFNNVLISQGNSLNGIPVNCDQPGGDTVIFLQATVNSDLEIFQNVALEVGVQRASFVARRR